MRLRNLGVGVAALLNTACETEQPPIGCPVQSLEWSATYKPKGQGTCPQKAGELLGIQKFSSPSGEEHLSIKPETLAELDERDPNPKPYSLGALPKQADANGYCVASSMSVAEKHAPEDTANSLPAKDIVYKWSNVRLVALPKAPGTQLVADLEYTEDGCTAQYEVWAMWPGDISCEDAQGRPDDSLCQGEATINPEFSVTCDPAQLRCVPAKRPPSLKE